MGDVALIKTESPKVWAGPILRKRDDKTQSIWWAANEFSEIEIVLFDRDLNRILLKQKIEVLTLSPQLHLYFVTISLTDSMANNDYYYDAYSSKTLDSSKGWFRHLELGFQGANLPKLSFGGSTEILCGSCRRMSFDGIDALAEAGRRYATGLISPDLIVLLGDQIYADHLDQNTWQLLNSSLAILGLEDYSEVVYNAGGRPTKIGLKKRFTSQNPWVKVEGVWDRTAAVKSMNFTTDHPEKQLILFSEWIGYYLLHWAPELLKISRQNTRNELSEEDFEEIENLTSIRKLMANVPVLMTSDDHDVTDDWNINNFWKHHLTDFGKATCRKGELAIALFQDWGNGPQRYDSIKWEMINNEIKKIFIGKVPSELHWDFGFYQQWGTSWIVAPDLRHFRKSSISQIDEPAGLIEPNKLNKMMRKLPQYPENLIFLSGTPVFGFELIEWLQRFAFWLSRRFHFSFLSKALTNLDLENWRADPDPKSASQQSYRSLLKQLYRISASRTLILSGDVHYAFVRAGSLSEYGLGSSIKNVWQINSSALRNKPSGNVFEKLSKMFNWLFSRTKPNDKKRPRLLSDKRKAIFSEVNYICLKLEPKIKVELHSFKNLDSNIYCFGDSIIRS